MLRHNDIKVMRYISLKVLLVFAFVLFITACSEEEEQDISNYIQTLDVKKVGDVASYAERYPETHYYELAAAADSIACYAGKSVAIFGGSLASNPESNVCKSMYYNLLHCYPIVTYGHGGFGFATEERDIQDYIPVLDRHDIYILWCSTNDYDTGVRVGTPTDYSEEDGYDESHTDTQCGGINRCIRAIREIDPNALIVGFTSLRFFGENGSREDGYIEDSPPKRNGLNFRDYVDKQRETFEKAGIPYFDQYNCGLFDVDNYAKFYFTDGFHLNEDGYFLLGCRQIRYFIDLAKEYQW